MHGEDGVSETADLFEEGKKRRAKKSFRRCCLVFVIIAVCLTCLMGLIVGLSVGVASRNSSRNVELPADPQERAVELLKRHPLIDGHNDIANSLRTIFSNNLSEVDLSRNTSGEYNEFWQTDIPRLRAGLVGAQFWSAYMSCTTQFKDATRTFLDQIDVIKRMVKLYPSTFVFASSTDDIENAGDRIASLIGVEGGHAIDSSLGTLRQLYALGARYMTLTHVCNTPWSHYSGDEAMEGLNDFGRRVVREMNRLGMLVDISHVNVQTMLDALNASRAPVIFSHSSAYALCNVPRNVPDNVLEKLKENGGIVMVNFYSEFINCTSPENATLSDVADHIDYLKMVAGIDHVGIGSDFNGIDLSPQGLEDVSKFPFLFAELIRRGYSDTDIAKIARDNFLRVFKAVEKLRDDSAVPDNTLIQPQPNQTCRPDF